MGVVYRAEHVVLGSTAAVKVLQPQFTKSSVVVERFFTDAKATSAIRHPGIVEVFDYGRLANNQAYIVMELLRGEDLTSMLMRQRTLAPSIAAQICLQVLSALEAAHVRGIVHRDIKPDNIYIVRDASAPGGIRAKILDFGIAKLLPEVHGPRAKTRGGGILGTPSYMAPEQCKGGAEIDARADLYAVGCILFELLVGRPPFIAEGSGEVMAMHIYEPAPRLLAFAPYMPHDLDVLLQRMLAKAPGDRTPSAAWALAALERVSLPPIVGEVVLVQRSPTPPPEVLAAARSGGYRAPRFPVAVLAIALALAAAAATIIGLS